MNGGAVCEGPELLALLTKSRSVPKGPDPNVLAMKKAAINAQIFYKNKKAAPNGAAIIFITY